MSGSAYQGRTGPNVSKFVNTLNFTDASPEEPFNLDDLDFSADLAMFTNTDFTQHDMPPLPEDNAFGFDMGHDKPEEMAYSDLLSGAEAHAFGPHAPANTPQNMYSQYNTPIQPAPPAGFGQVDNRSRQAPSGPANARRKAGSVESEAFSPEDRSRVAAEEDKRRRNTAASARFRVKKKQREQALEKNMKDVTDKNSKLEAKVSQLEMENKWLKELITTKNDMPSREIAEAWQQFKRESEERDEEHTTGVGTH